MEARFDEGGIDAFRAMSPRRPALLDARQLEGLPRALLQRPAAHGFGTELWNVRRVGLLIESWYGVSFSEGHVWRILSPQKPQRRAIEREEARAQLETPHLAAP